MDKWQSKTQRSIRNILINWTNCENILKQEITSKQWMNIFKKIGVNLGHKEFSHDDFDEQIASTFSQLMEIIESDDVHLIPGHLLEGLGKKLTSLLRQVRTFFDFCQLFHDRGKNLSYSIDSEMTLSFESKTGEITHIWNLVDEFEEIFNKVNDLLNIESSVMDIIKENILKSKELQENEKFEENAKPLLTEIAYMQSKIEKEYKAGKPLYEEIKQLQGQTRTGYKEIKRAQEDIKHIFSELAQFSSTFATDKAVIEERKAEIIAITDSAEKLSAKIKSHESELKEAGKKRKELETDMDKTIAKVELLLANVEDTNQRAKNMLGLATPAGLSNKFNIREQDINSQFFWAQIIHFIVLILFIIYTLSIFTPLGVHLNLLKESFVSDSMEFKTLLFKFTLILPFLLLIGFTNRRYKELFKLKEHYAYKDSIAVSIPSFKEQAGDYGDLVATTLFSKLTFNPADDIGKAKEKNADILTENEPLYKTAFEAMEKRVKAIGGGKMTDTIKANDTTETDNANGTTKANDTTETDNANDTTKANSTTKEN